MNLLTPFAQEGPGVPTGEQQTQALQEPLIDAPNPIEWLGFGAGAVIFLIIILFMIRARVIAPARRRAAAKQAIFEPAGEDAEITFDDDAPPSPQSGNADNRSEDNPFAEPVKTQQPDEPHGENEPEREVQKSRSPFAGLFSQKRDRKDEPDQVGLGEPENYDSIAEASIEPAAADDDDSPSHDSHAVKTQSSADQFRKLDDDVEMRRRLAEQEERERLLEEAQLQTERASAEQSKKLQEERDRAYHAAREDALRETEFERRKNEAALEQRLRSLASVERKLSEKADTLGADAQFVEKRLSETMEERFAALSEELNQRLAENAETAARANDETQPSAADMADYVGRELANLRRSMQDSIERLTKRIDEVKAAPQGGANLAAQVAELGRRLDAKPDFAVAPTFVSLSRLIRRFAALDHAAFDARLPNGQSVDCIVTPEGGGAPIAINAQYPVEAYERYMREHGTAGGNAQAANAYRRAVLREVVHIAENMIIPGETASSAMLFAPADAIVNDLHANFPDLIEDSYQARVWIVSPASLGLTLSTIAAVFQQTNAGNAPLYSNQSDVGDIKDDTMLAEIDMLRERVAKRESDDVESSEPLTPPEDRTLAAAPIESEEDALAAPEDRLASSDDSAPKANGVAAAGAGADHGYPSMSPEEEAFERLERLEREEARADISPQEGEDDGNPTERPPFPLR